MPLTFVFGPSGSGKSYTLYQKTIEASMRHPEQNYMILVPEQFTLQTQKDMVTMHPRHGIMNIDVLSFGRLAYRVFEETGAGALPALDDVGKNLILRKVAADCEGELRILRGHIRKPGYISEIKSVISEFMQYDVREEELTRVMDGVGRESGLGCKLHDIGVLYQAFLAYLKEKYITKEELLDVLASVVRQSRILPNTTIVLDGFTGFTPVQNRLILELIRVCREVYVTVTMDEREDPFSYEGPCQLFGLSKKMVASLTALVKTNGEKLNEPVCLYQRPLPRFGEKTELSFLEQNLFRRPVRTFSKIPERIAVHLAQNPREETLAAAGRIRRLVREKGFRYREVGVILSSMEDYGEEMERALSQYDIPFFTDRKRSILLNPFVEYLRSVLSLADQNFSYESVFRYLHTGLAGFTSEEVDRLDNYCVGLGIKGKKRWHEPWTRGLKHMSPEEVSAAEELRKRLIGQTGELFAVLRKRKKTVAQITGAVYDFMVRERMQIRLKEQEERFLQEGELSLAKEYSQIYRILIELFDKFVELLGGEAVTLKEYCELLDAGLEETRVGVIPPAADQVLVGDIERTRLKDIKALVLVGAVDTCLPGQLTRNGLLCERDREAFDAQKLSLSPGGRERTYIQRFYLYQNLTKPSECLDIYYSKVSADGKSRRPSYLVRELLQMYPELCIKEEERCPLSERELTPETALREWIEGMREPERAQDFAWQALHAWYLQSPGWQGKIRTLLKAGRYHRPADPLSEELARELYGDHFMDSISRIETFYSCAFAHFAGYGLRLSEREEDKFEALELGNICHIALERFAGKIKTGGLGWATIPQNQADRLMEESLSEILAEQGGGTLSGTARGEAMLDRIRILLERSVWAMAHQLRAGDFEAEEFEIRFADGKIDRIDVCEDADGVYVKVLDYKTGRQAFDIGALYHGLQLQLMVYMDAAVRLEQKKHPKKPVIPAGVFYYRIDDPIADVSAVPDADEQTVEQLLLKKLRPDGVVRLEGNALEHLEHEKSGESLAVPVKFNKDGSLSKTSKAVPADCFDRMVAHALRMVRQAHERILNGEVTADPYRMGNRTACDWCIYRHVCGFDLRIPGYGYRELEKVAADAFAKEGDASV